jgi:hypothetical protein
MRLLAGVFAALVLAPAAHAGGPTMRIGATEDQVKQLSLVQAKAKLELLKLGGLDSVRVTLIWAPGQTAPVGDDQKAIANVLGGAALAGIKAYVGITQFGSRTTPLTDEDRSDFSKYAAAVAKTFPLLAGVIVGNEPNLNRFWLPQFNPDGTDAAAPAFLRLLAQAYDAIKAAQPTMKVYGIGLSPRGGDNPNASRLTHSPTVFLRDLGSAYRASGRTAPIMDALAFHPYQDNSSQPPTFQHPNSTTISIADYGKLVKLLGEAFDGTAQKGSTLPILYDEYGVESLIPTDHSLLYTGDEPTTTHPVDEATQGAYYKQAIAIAFCQPNVDGILLFHAIDESELSAWQSGLYYADATPKTSLSAVGQAASQARRGVVAKCDGLRLTPKLKTLAWPTQTQLRRHETSVSFVCDIDCTYEARLMRAGKLVTRKIGTATGGSVWNVPLRKRLAAGSYSIRLALVAAVNVGNTVSRAKNVRVT